MRPEDCNSMLMAVRAGRNGACAGLRKEKMYLESESIPGGPYMGVDHLKDRKKRSCKKRNRSKIVTCPKSKPNQAGEEGTFV